MNISIIVSSFEFPIGALLDSLSKQTGDLSFEVLICDDGSNSAQLATLAAAASSSGLDCKILWQRSEGFRLSRSRNNGIRVAQGDILLFLDSDVWLPSTFLLRHFSLHIPTEARLVCGPRARVHISQEEILTSGDIFNASALHAPSKEMIAQQAWIDSSWPWMACQGFAMSIRRSDLVFFDETFEAWGGEDREFALRLFKTRGVKIICPLDLVVVHIEFPGVSDSRHPFVSQDSEAIANWILNKYHLRRSYPNEDLTPALKPLLRCHLHPGNDRWFVGAEVRGRKVEEVFEEWLAWKQRRTSQ